MKERLSQIPGAAVKFERAPGAGVNPDDASRSYWVVFLSPNADHFSFKTQEVAGCSGGPGEPGNGQGWVGLMAAVSAIAPFAAVRLDEFEVYENGFRMEPDVEPHLYEYGAGKSDLEKKYSEFYGEEGFSALRDLRASICRVLEELEITVIPEEVLDRKAPKLRAGENLRTVQAGKAVTVEQSFFYEWD